MNKDIKELTKLLYIKKLNEDLLSDLDDEDDDSEFVNQPIYIKLLDCQDESSVISNLIDRHNFINNIKYTIEDWIKSPFNDWEEEFHECINKYTCTKLVKYVRIDNRHLPIKDETDNTYWNIENDLKLHGYIQLVEFSSDEIGLNIVDKTYITVMYYITIGKENINHNLITYKIFNTFDKSKDPYNYKIVEDFNKKYITTFYNNLYKLIYDTLSITYKDIINQFSHPVNKLNLNLSNDELNILRDKFKKSYLYTEWRYESCQYGIKQFGEDKFLNNMFVFNIIYSKLTYDDALQNNKKFLYIPYITFLITDKVLPKIFVKDKIDQDDQLEEWVEGFFLSIKRKERANIKSYEQLVLNEMNKYNITLKDLLVNYNIYKDKFSLK